MSAASPGRCTALQLVEPPEQDLDLLWRGLLVALSNHHEPLAVGSHVVTWLELPLEENGGSSDNERGLRFDRDGVHLLALAVEELASRGRPDGINAPIGRNLYPASRSGIRRDVDLIAARLVGGVGDPFPIRREGGLMLVERRLQEDERLAIPFQRQDPEVVSGGGIHVEERKELAVRGEGLRSLQVIARRQAFLGPAPVRGSPIKVRPAAATGVPCDAPTVRRPDAIVVVSSKRKARQGPSLDLVHPDVEGRSFQG